MSRDAVSVIIPAFNAEACLGTAIESARRQDYAPAEIIVVDDGSTDATRAVMESYAHDVRGFALAHAGPGAARNAGMRLAAGDYLALLDADDFWHPRFLAECVQFLKAHPAAVAVSTAGTVLLGNGTARRVPAPRPSPALPAQPGMLDDFFGFWARHDHVRTGTVVMRADAVRRAGLQREDLRVSQDLEYWALLATHGPWGFIPEPLWFGNSVVAALSVNWITKYHERRLLCPDVKQWGARVEPRLSSGAMVGYSVVRGRVAAGLAHHQVLAGRGAEARAMIRLHGASMPRTRVANLMRVGAATGPVGWSLACLLLRSLELRKARRGARR
jgi:glycosyltransferase involved in cell wall biosynthesis